MPCHYLYNNTFTDCSSDWPWLCNTWLLLEAANLIVLSELCIAIQTSKQCVDIKVSTVPWDIIVSCVEQLQLLPEFHPSEERLSSIDGVGLGASYY